MAAALIEHAENDPILRKKLRMLLAGTEGPGKLAAELGKRIQTIGRSRSFVDWDKRKPLVQELGHIRTTIGTALAAQNPGVAIERLWDFIGIADRVFERVGDGIGEVEEIFGEALTDLGRLIAADPDRDTTSFAGNIDCARGMLKIENRPGCFARLATDASSSAWKDRHQRIRVTNFRPIGISLPSLRTATHPPAGTRFIADTCERRIIQDRWALTNWSGFSRLSMLVRVPDIRNDLVPTCRRT